MPLLQYKRRFLAFINKENINHMQGQIDPMDYHSMFFTLATLYNVMENKEMSLWLYILPVSTTISGVTAATIFFISLVHYVQVFKINLIAECGTYLIIMMFKLVIRMSTSRGKKYYQDLLKALQDDFRYVCTDGQKYREKFFESQKLTFQLCIFAAAFLGFFGSGMAMCACIAAVLAIQNQDESVKRPLPYPYWLFDYNIHASPIYEILFVASILFTVLHTKQLIFMLQSHLVWIRQITSRADVIIWKLQDLLVDVLSPKTKDEKEQLECLTKHRMSNIIEMHHSMYDLMNGYAAVAKPCLFYEQIFATTVIFMTAYCFAEKYDQGEFELILILLCMGTIGMVFVPCYLCTHLLEKVQSIADACWDVPFWETGVMIRPYLVLIMQRSRRPLPIVAAGFDDISLQTYSRMMTRAYSWFQMLRQADVNFS